ncbi:MAG TPA: DUF1508 domain-containing protein [Longimicrobium sp.]|nr:DUF1508 domain-containing protein [Longimicrobium sp.]
MMSTSKLREPASRSARREHTMGYYIYEDKDGYWRWYLLGPGHRRIAVSPDGYLDRQDCRNVITLVKGSADTPVHEV